MVRVTHWITVISFFALLITGGEIVISHPRFYWGETGNVNMRPLFTIPIPSSRDTVPTGYGYVMPDQNGWSRYLHFQAAWVLVLTGLVYVLASLWNGHLRKNLLPAKGERSWRAVWGVIARYLRRAPARCGGSPLVQRGAADRISVGDLRPLPAGDLDGTGAVSGLQFRGAGGGQCAGRTAVGAHAAFLRLRIAGDLSGGARGDGGPGGVLEPGAGDDHGAGCGTPGAYCHKREEYRRTVGAQMSKISRRKLITGGLAATAGVSGLAVAAGPGQALWAGASRLPRNLRTGRDADLCGAAASDETLAGAGVSSQHDFGEALRQRNLASQRCVQASSGQRISGLEAFS